MPRRCSAAISGFFLTLSLVLGAGCGNESPTSPSAPGDGPASAAKSLGPDLVDVMVVYENRLPNQALAASGAVSQRVFRRLPLVHVTLPAGALDDLRGQPGVLSAEPCLVGHDDKKGDVEVTWQTTWWGVDRIDAEYVHEQADNRGEGVNVADLGRGSDMNHPDLTYAGGYSVTGRDPDVWDDKDGHGTHTCGIISADDNDEGVLGVAPSCDMYPVQVAAMTGYLEQDVIAGIDWCIDSRYDGDPDNDVQIISMSFGFDEPSVAFETALETAYAEGILLIASAGNDGQDVADHWPAAYSCVMAIANANSDDTMVSSSNSGEEIELIAPGNQILSTIPGGDYDLMSGTSMACPHVSGVAALVWAANPTWSNAEVRAHLHATAEDIGLPPEQQGYGLVDAEKAVMGTTSGDD